MSQFPNAISIAFRQLHQKYSLFEQAAILVEMQHKAYLFIFQT